MTNNNFTIRSLKPGDIAYITSTWMNSFRSNSKWAKDILHRIYSSEHNRIINEVLNVAEVFVACDNDDPNHVFGYLVMETVPNVDLDIYHYVYIKGAFQKMGIASDLVAKSKKGSRAVFTQKNSKASWISDKLLKDYEDINYNPYLFFRNIK